MTRTSIRACLIPVSPYVGPCRSAGITPPAASPWQPVIGLLLEIWGDARARGDFDQADLIRERLAAARIEVRDGDEGTKWHEA